MIKSHFLCFLKIHKHLNVISKIKLRFFWHLTVNLIFVSYIQNIHTYKHIDHLYKYVHTCTYLYRYFEVSSQPFHLKKDKELHVHDSDFHSHELSSCSALQCVAVRCSALQCVAVRCSSLQCIAVRCSVHSCTFAHMFIWGHTCKRTLLQKNYTNLAEMDVIEKEWLAVRIKARRAGTHIPIIARCCPACGVPTPVCLTTPVTWQIELECDMT